MKPKRTANDFEFCNPLAPLTTLRDLNLRSQYAQLALINVFAQALETYGKVVLLGHHRHLPP